MGTWNDSVRCGLRYPLAFRLRANVQGCTNAAKAGQIFAPAKSAFPPSMAVKAESGIRVRYGFNNLRIMNGEKSC
jgi:hypothetical protein